MTLTEQLKTAIEVNRARQRGILNRLRVLMAEGSALGMTFTREQWQRAAGLPVSPAPVLRTEPEYYI